MIINLIFIFNLQVIVLNAPGKKIEATDEEKEERAKQKEKAIAEGKYKESEGKLKGVIKPGYTPIVDCHTAHVACKFETIHQKIDRRTGKILEEHPAYLVAGDAAMITLVPHEPMCVESFAD